MLKLALLVVGFLLILGVIYVIALKAGLLDGGAAGEKPADDRPAPADARYRRREPGVLTEHERAFVPTLEKAARQLLDDLGPLRVLAKVRLGDLIEPEPTPGDRRLQVIARNQVNQKHADFVLVDADWRAVCVVELDDSSHRRSKAKANDEKKDAAMMSAGVPVVRVTGRDGADAVVRKVRDTLRGH